MKGIKRSLLFFLPTLVFLIGLTSSYGEFVFRPGPPAHVSPGILPSYAVFYNNTLYLYSSPYAPWPYEGAVKVELYVPAYIYINSTCPFAAPAVLGGAVGTWSLNLTVPPLYEGSCLLNFTGPSGWRQAVLVKVKLVDWYPSPRRVVVTLEGRGWQFIQVGQDGTLYVWERPIAALPVVGCAAIYNGSLLLAERLSYGAAQPYVIPAPLLPGLKGEERYGFFLRLSGRATLYIYESGCPYVNASSASSPPPDPRDYAIAVGVPTLRGYVYDTPSYAVRKIATNLRNILVANGTAMVYKLYSYWYGTPVGMWGGVLYFDFKPEPLLTTYISFFSPGNATPVHLGDGVWLFNGTVKYWVAGPEEPLQRPALPVGVPMGWQGPFYVVADPTGEWGGWPKVAGIQVEELKPWGP